MLTCFRSSGRTPALCMGSVASCAPQMGTSASTAAAAVASDASNASRKPNLRDANTLVPHLLAHFQIFIALQHEAAWPGLVLFGNIGRKERRVADARRNICCSARGQALLQRQFHGAIHGDPHHTVVFVRPSVRIQELSLL